MNRNSWFFLIVLLILEGMGWTAQAQANDQIVEAQGRVEIRRSSQRFWGAVGTDLEYGDLLRPERQARITVLCSNNTQWRVPAGRLSGLGNGCPISTVRSLRGRGEDDFLTFLNQQFVYETQFLSASPLLRWNPSPDVSGYNLRVMQGGQAIWQQQSDRPEIAYTGPMLQPGVDYLLQVFVPNTETPIATLKFQVLNPTQTTAIQTAIAQLPQSLTPEARAIALTRIDLSVGIPTNPSDRLRPGLVTEAIAALEPLITDGNRTPYLHRLLGDLDLQVGLLNQAEARYQEAIALSRASDNTTERALAQIGLANTRAAQGDLSEASMWLQLARFNYMLLGHSDRTALIDQWLARIVLLQ